MKGIDELGQFWLVGHEEDVLSGRLRFDPRDGCTLSLVGIFGNESEDDRDEMARIIGWIGSNRVTLDRCFLKKSNRGSTGIQKCEYYANQLFIGHHMTEDDMEFGSAEVEWSDFDSWVSQSGIQETYPERNELSGPLYQMTLAPTENQEATFAGGCVAL